MTNNIEIKLINKALILAATGIQQSDDDQGSSQINMLLNMIQSEPTDAGIARLILFIYRQNGRKQKNTKVISDAAKELLINDIEWMRKKNNAPKLIAKYLNYLKWSFDAVKSLNKNQKRKVAKSEEPLDMLVGVSK